MIRTLIKTGLAICLAATLANAEGGIVKGEVVESINAAGYTYLKIKTKDNENKWAAVMQGDYKVGTPITVTEDMTTQNFTSKALGITFDSIVFGKVAKDSMKKPMNDVKYDESTIVKSNIAELLAKSKDFKDKVAKDSMKKPMSDVKYDEATIVKTNIAELLAKSKDFKDKVVQVEGKVTKVSVAIMKSNWIHIVDKDLNKIIFRSQNNNVKVGQEIVATGKADTDVDYGYGYKYDIIILDSVFK